MSPKRSGVTTFAALLVGWGAVHAGEPVSAPASGVNSATNAQEGVDPPATAKGAGTPGDGSETPPVCFKLTLHCIDKKAAKSDTSGATRGTAPVDSSSTQANAGSGKASPSKASPSQPLNLNAPDVRTVVPAEELREPVQTEEQQQAAEDTDTVQVKGESTAPDVPGGFGALWWAMKHPSEAWRIFTPVE